MRDEWGQPMPVPAPLELFRSQNRLKKNYLEGGIREAQINIFQVSVSVRVFLRVIGGGVRVK